MALRESWTYCLHSSGLLALRAMVFAFTGEWTSRFIHGFPMGRTRSIFFCTHCCTHSLLKSVTAVSYPFRLGNVYHFLRSLSFMRFRVAEPGLEATSQYSLSGTLNISKIVSTPADYQPSGPRGGPAISHNDCSTLLNSLCLGTAQHFPTTACPAELR